MIIASKCSNIMTEELFLINAFILRKKMIISLVHRKAPLNHNVISLCLIFPNEAEKLPLEIKKLN